MRWIIGFSVGELVRFIREPSAPVVIKQGVNTLFFTVVYLANTTTALYTSNMYFRASPDEPSQGLIT